MKEKACAKCGEKKTEVEFSPDKRKNDGLYARCKICRAEDGRIHYEATPEESRKRYRDWARKNPGKVRKSNRNWRGRNRFSVVMQQSRAAAKKRGYVPCNATAEEIEYAFSGKCAICGVPEIECNGRLQMDHDHETGEFRGFLCGKCNRAIGLLNDSEELLIDALHYLMNCKIK